MKGVDTLNCLYGYEDIHFVNDTVGFIAGSCGMKKTQDGGYSWDVYSNSNYNEYRNLFFFNADTGVAFAYPGYDVIKTVDGGANWSFKFSYDIPSNFSFPSNDSIGFIASSVPFGNPSLIYRTTNYGDTWSLWGNLTYATIDENWIEEIFFADYATGFAGSDGGKIYKTTDGGLTWNLTAYPYGGEFKEIFFLDSLNGFVLTTVGGVFPVSGGGAYRTINGGVSWSVIFSGSASTGIEFFDSIGYLSADEKILKSTDRGQTWNNEWIGFDVIFDISFVNDSTGFAFDYDSVYSGFYHHSDTSGNGSTDTSYAWAFPDSGIVWCQSMSWGIPTDVYGNLNHQIFPDGSDTIINGLKYYKLFHTGTDFISIPLPFGRYNSFHKELYGFFRNDTLSEKVEFRTTNNSISSIIYDFNLNVGDTCYPYDEQTIVDSISTVWLNGIARRVYHYGGGWLTGYFIEGIGPYTGLGEAAFSVSTDYAANLNCLSINDSSYRFLFNSGNHPDSFDIFSDTTCNWCSQIPTAVNGMLSTKVITIYPNPASDKIAILFEHPPTSSFLVIQNIYGQIMSAESISSNSKEVIINIISLAAGTYSATIRTDQGISVSRFLVTR